jgi:hypothetical protein
MTSVDGLRATPVVPFKMRPLKSICRSNPKKWRPKINNQLQWRNSSGPPFLCGPHCREPCSSPPRCHARLQAQPPALLLRLLIHNRFLKPTPPWTHTPSSSSRCRPKLELFSSSNHR